MSELQHEITTSNGALYWILGYRLLQMVMGLGGNFWSNGSTCMDKKEGKKKKLERGGRKNSRMCMRE